MAEDGGGGDALLGDLGVTTVSAADVEQQLWDKAQERLNSRARGSGRGAAGDAEASGPVGEYMAVRREIRALKSALQSQQDSAAAAGGGDGAEVGGSGGDGDTGGGQRDESGQRAADVATAGGSSSGRKVQQPEVQQQGPVGPSGRLSLQEAMLNQRLGQLTQRMAQLQEQLGDDVPPPEDDAVGRVSGGGGGGIPPPARRQRAGLPPSGASKRTKGTAAIAGGVGRGRGGGGGGGGGRGGAKAKGGKPAAGIAAAALAEGGKGEDMFGDAAAVRGTALVETERDRLIRLGVLTPFDALDGFERRVTRQPTQEQQSGGGDSGPRPREGEGEQEGAEPQSPGSAAIQRMRQRVRAVRDAKPRIQVVDPADMPAPEPAARRIPEHYWRQAASGSVKPPKAASRKSTLPRHRRKRVRLRGEPKRKRVRREVGSRVGDVAADGAEEAMGEGLEGEGPPGRTGSAVGGNRGGDGTVSASGSEYGPSDDDVASGDESLASEYESVEGDGGVSSEGYDSDDATGEFDDAEEELWQRRRAHYLAGTSGGEGGGVEEVQYEGGYRIPASVYDKLFPYQQTCVKWMWELHTQRAGGIIGDEMGLGKTVQVISFLAGLHHSGHYRPSLIACPATVLRQWLRELRKWYPLFRVVVLHDSARSPVGMPRPSRSQLVDLVAGCPAGVLLTTYDQLRINRDLLLPVQWGYAVLDEGHKIRNPDSEITLVVKQLPTVHRIIMSGSPIQNRLTELWSLFDFVFPGKLGTLPVFQAEFAVPIQIGGYANANPVQVSTAYRCAVVLRDLIQPYLLRRHKKDVGSQLPKKTEQVLFCRLTREQRDIYRAYISSKEVQEIFAGNRNALAGIDILRKVCNHPDLLDRATQAGAEQYGDPCRSGKLQVVQRVLRHWREQKHKALVFTQTQQMLDILQKLAEGEGYTFHRMDGSTSISQRMRLMDDFNDNPNVFLFLLTTKVGGLGVNLTGANRVLLYDPDWNPSTDVQARERAWRIGQTRDVTIYRLITAGTIEEKVYHRQVYKHFLTDKVLRDPRQRRFFNAKDIQDLFTLGDVYRSDRGCSGAASHNETAGIFAELGGEIRPESGMSNRSAGSNGGVGAFGEEVGEEEEGREVEEQDGGGGGGGRSSRGSGGGGRPRRRGSTGSLVGGGAAGNGPGSSSSPVPGGGPGRASGGGGGSRQQEAGRGAEAEGEEKEEEEEDDDARILRDLFDGTGVTSAMDHSKIEGANQQEKVAMVREADRVAQAATERLRKSRLECQQTPINLPTWTGRSGAAGLPGFATANGSGGGGQRQLFGSVINPRLQQHQQAGGGMGAGGSGGGGVGAAGGMGRLGGGAGLAGGMGGARSSGDVLAQIRRRQQAAESSGAADPALADAEALAARIVSFLESAGGRAPSSRIVAAFGSDLPPQQVPLFKSVLKQVATLTRDEGGTKVWQVKPEFTS